MRAVFGLVRLDAGRVLWDRRPIGLPERLRFGYTPEGEGCQRVRQLFAGEHLPSALGRIGMDVGGLARPVVHMPHIRFGRARGRTRFKAEEEGFRTLDPPVTDNGFRDRVETLDLQELFVRSPGRSPADGTSQAT